MRLQKRHSDMLILTFLAKCITKKTKQKSLHEDIVYKEVFIFRLGIDIQTELTGADETNFLSFLCLFVLSK